MDIKEREMQKVLGLMKVWGWKYVIQKEDGTIINNGLEVAVKNTKRTCRRGYFDDLLLEYNIFGMNIGDVVTVNLAGTKFTVKEVAAQVSGLGIHKFGAGNFTTHRIKNAVECMRTG